MTQKPNSNTRDAEWLYEQLTRNEDDFCDSLLSLTMRMEANHSVERTWGIYLSLMDRVGQELFGGEPCLSPVSETVDSNRDAPLNWGYASTIHKLIMGAYLLFDLIRPPKFRAKLTALKKLSAQNHAVTLRYLTGELPFVTEQDPPWSFIDHSHRRFSEVYGMVREMEEECRDALLSAEERSALMKKQFEDKLERIFEELFSSTSDEPKSRTRKIYRIVSRSKRKN
jgi:hypothetical protein